MVDICQAQMILLYAQLNYSAHDMVQVGKPFLLHYYITTSANLDLYHLSPAGAGFQIQTGSTEDGWTDLPSV